MIINNDNFHARLTRLCNWAVCMPASYFYVQVASRASVFYYNSGPIKGLQMNLLDRKQKKFIACVHSVCMCVCVIVLTSKTVARESHHHSSGVIHIQSSMKTCLVEGKYSLIWWGSATGKEHDHRTIVLKYSTSPRQVVVVVMHKGNISWETNTSDYLKTYSYQLRSTIYPK